MAKKTALADSTNGGSETKTPEAAGNNMNQNGDLGQTQQGHPVNAPSESQSDQGDMTDTDVISAINKYIDIDDFFWHK